MPNGTYGGVRGRKTKVGRKLSFSSYSIYTNGSEPSGSRHAEAAAAYIILEASSSLISAPKYSFRLKGLRAFIIAS